MNGRDLLRVTLRNLNVSRTEMVKVRDISEKKKNTWEDENRHVRNIEY